MQTSSPLPLRDALQDADLCRAWRQLLAASPAYQALLDPDWWRSASDHLGHASHWYLACRHDGKDLRWLVLVQPRQALGMRWWQTAHHNHLPVAAMLRHPRVDPLQASNEVAQTLREDGALFLRCVRVPPGPVSESLQRSVSPPPAYTFPTGDFDTLFAGRSRNLRKQIRRREKRLAEQAHVRFEVINNPNHPTLGLDAFYQLEASGWKQDSASAIAFHEPLRNFYRQAAEDFAARGQFRLFALLADDAPIAMEYTLLCSDRRLYTLKCAYDERWSKVSPGQLLLCQVWRWCCENSLREYNQVTSASWLEPWDPVVLPMSSGYIFAEGWRGRLARWSYDTLYRLRNRLRPRAAATSGYVAAPLWLEHATPLSQYLLLW